jgi:zinc transporter ZupT
MAVSLPFGIFVALAMALHNVPEATALAAALRDQGVRLAHAASLGIVANTSQVLLAVASFAVVRAAPDALPWALGFAMGALIYLVLAELLPQSYRQAGRTTIAAVTLLAMATVVLVGGVLNAGA